MIKIHDCSNSSERPIHRGGGGPITNDIMRYLQEYANDYRVKFVRRPEDAQVIITNDVFPSSIIKLGIPLVKRMCSPFWQSSMLYRNQILNKAAEVASKVIFISEYSKEQYLYLYGDNLKSYCVVPNRADYKVFNDFHLPRTNDFTFAACATNWNRKEKRLSDLIKFAEIRKDINFIIIGTVEQHLPKNMLKVGYISDPKEISRILNSVNGFINFSYRDACPKTVSQAISCGLPILYSDSGGTNEMIFDCGIPIKDNNYLGFEDEVPSLDMNDVLLSFNGFQQSIDRMNINLHKFDREAIFRNMLENYFNEIKITSHR